MTKKILMLLFLVLGLTGCSVFEGKHYDEDVSLRIVKSGIKIEDVGFDPDMGHFDGMEVYRFTIPIEITGTFEHDTTIPIYYDFDGNRSVLEIQKSVSDFAYDGGLAPVFQGKIEIKKGMTGIVYFEGESDAHLHNPDSTPYEHAWVALEYDDGFVPDNYAGVTNPFYNEEKWSSWGADHLYEEMRQIEPQETKGNVSIDDSSVTIEKTYVGDEPGKPQHYKVSVTISNDPDNPVSTDDLWIACDYGLASPIFSHDCYDTLYASLLFAEGVSLGYTTVQQKSITQNEDSITVEFDMYNRYVTENKTKLGSDLDGFFCFWISICLDDENRNDNYVIVPNPYFNETLYEDVGLDIYDDYTFVGAWRAYWREN